MPTLPRRRAERAAGIASACGSALGYAILIASCYFVAVLAAQTMLFVETGQGFGSTCALHGAISGTGGCQDYVSHLAFAGGFARFALTELNALVLIFGAICLLSMLRIGVGAMSGRVSLAAAHPGRGAVASSGR
jgi:hypothetical protein